jgi:hypothetical protein
MAEAHEAWRASLAGVTLAGTLGELPASVPARTRSILGRM